MTTIGWGVIAAALLLAPLAPAGRADDNSGNSVRWETIVGSVLPANAFFSNPIGGIPAGTDPWSTLGGHAYVNLTSGVVDFEVKGLVFGNNVPIGTPGPVKQIKGTLVCAPGSEQRLVIDTPVVALSPQGDATFKGLFTSPTTHCSAKDIAFLVRNAKNNRWIAYGAVRVP
jgi:hypothetical protein